MNATATRTAALRSATSRVEKAREERKAIARLQRVERYRTDAVEALTRDLTGEIVGSPAWDKGASLKEKTAWSNRQRVLQLLAYVVNLGESLGHSVDELTEITDLAYGVRAISDRTIHAIVAFRLAYEGR